MPADIGQIAAAAVAVLAPFLPYLIDAGKFSGEALAEMVVQEGGEAAWKKAQTLWGKLKTHFGNDPEVQSAATLVAANQEDVARQTMLAEVLGARLKENPDLAQEILSLLGGQPAVQQVLAERGSWVEDVTQRMKGHGKQVVRASVDSVIKGVRQEQQ